MKPLFFSLWFLHQMSENKADEKHPSELFSFLKDERKLPFIDEASCLEQCETAEFVAEMLGEMMAEFDKQEKNIQAALAGKEEEEATHKAFASHGHAIKGASANLFLGQISAVAYNIEMLGKRLAASVAAGKGVKGISF